MIIVYGIGLGYHAKALREVTKAEIIFVDPHIDSETRKSITLPENVHLTSDWRSFKETYSVRINRWKPITVTALPAYDSAYKVEYLAFCKTLAREVQAVISDRCTSLRFSFDWQKNVLKNYRFIAETFPVQRLFGKWKRPAIIVASGPSLDKNIHLLREAKGKALIFAVGSSLPRLLSEGIEPDFALAFDGGIYNYIGHFQDLKSNVPLIFDTILHYKILEEYQGPKVLMSIWPTVQFIKPFLGEIGSVDIGPSVANTCFDLCVKLGADPIIFVGQDLAYTNDLTHAKGTHGEKTIDARKGYALRDRDCVTVIGQNGEKLKSNSSMVTFLHWFEETFQRYPQKTILNATEGGANIRGARNTTLKEAISALSKDVSRETDQLKAELFRLHEYKIDKFIQHIRVTRAHVESLLSRFDSVLPEQFEKEMTHPKFALIAFALQPLWEAVQSGDKDVKPLARYGLEFVLPLLDETISSLRKAA